MTDYLDHLPHLIRSLGLKPHPEGGWYRQVYRSTSKIQPNDGRSTRTAVTAIYYLLQAAEVSRWHRVHSDEIWYLLEGAPLDLYVASPDFSMFERHRLDRVANAGQPWLAVPAGWWQAAKPSGAFALASCVVGPGFEYEDFALLADDPAGLAAAIALPDEYRNLI